MPENGCCSWWKRGWTSCFQALEIADFREITVANANALANPHCRYLQNCSPHFFLGGICFGAKKSSIYPRSESWQRSTFSIRIIVNLKHFSGGHCLDVRFDDPTTGFFLRQKTYASSPQMASSSTSGLDEAVVPTTSIILGTKEKARDSPERRLLVQPSEAAAPDDILHKER